MIDWSSVTELRNEIGEDDFGEVVELFLEEVAEVIERLRTTSGHSHLEQDLHFLKGSALNLGFSAFSSLCQDGERLAQAGQAGDIKLDEVLDCYEKSRAVFLADLASHCAA